MKKLLIPIVIAMSLAACGGGGGGSSTPSAPPVVVHPLEKYDGQYFGECTDGGHSRNLMVMQAYSTDSTYLATGKVIYYTGKGCTGTVSGQLVWSVPDSAKWKSTSTHNVVVATGQKTVPVDIVDFTLTASNYKLTGPGVVGNCVIIDTGKLCVSAPTKDTTTSNVGFYKENGVFYIMLANSTGTYIPVELFVDYKN